MRKDDQQDPNQMLGLADKNFRKVILKMLLQCKLYLIFVLCVTKIVILCNKFVNLYYILDFLSNVLAVSGFYSNPPF